MSRRKISPEEKLAAVKSYLNGEGSLRQIARMYNVNEASLRQWIRNYQSIGPGAFVRGKNQKYSVELKMKVLQEYWEGHTSQNEICKKYKLKSRKQLRDWIQEYNSYGRVTSPGTGGSAFMTKGRKTTLDERVEIVRYCIAHDNNYSETAEKYGISYQQARSYTVKYQEGGVEALEDRRGKPKYDEDMNELDRLRRENKLLRAEKERAEMEVAFLKKLEEIERRRG